MALDLYHYSPLCIDKTSTPDRKNWGSIYNFIGLNISLVDRSGVIKMPYRTAVVPGMEIPSPGTALSYKDCASNRVKELIALQDKTGLHLKLFYSGGIDSTCMLVSFITELGYAELKNRATVYISQESIDENPKFYYEHLRGNINIASSENFNRSLNNKSIMVGGEFNDQIFGSDIIRSIMLKGIELHKPYKPEVIIGLFEFNGETRRMSHETAVRWYELLKLSADTTLPGRVVTVWDFFWWYNFSCKWQNIYFRMLAFTSRETRFTLDKELLDVSYQHFFSTEDFQRWSIYATDRFYSNEWKDYKREAKQLIFDYNKDADYLDRKLKCGSLYNLFRGREFAKCVTSDFKFQDTLNSDDFYDPSNSFT
jgi:hypothetical protein